MIEFRCDHCGHPISGSDVVEYEVRARIFPNAMCMRTPIGTGSPIHLCGKCQKKLGEWLSKASTEEFDWTWEKR